VGTLLAQGDSYRMAFGALAAIPIACIIVLALPAQR